ncbi:uncharacterized protein LOC143462594 [Clavelina lepadiformis]|uniref:Uncharacterized protein n=1 Tax=Clavelina lepadiformis TaxID=159417 RepID=A0ABP0FNX8_CLALP
MFREVFAALLLLACLQAIQGHPQQKEGFNDVVDCLIFTNESPACQGSCSDECASVLKLAKCLKRNNCLKSGTKSRYTDCERACSSVSPCRQSQLKKACLKAKFSSCLECYFHDRNCKPNSSCETLHAKIHSH